MTLIAFVGFKGSGKNTAAIPLIDHGFKAFSFADAIKDCLSAIFCWDRQMLEGITPESRTWREQIDPWWAEKLGIPNFSPRWAMMNFGTQLMREHFNINIWLYNMERRIMAVGDKPVAILDCRFANELEMVRRYRGRIIRIRRGPDPDWMEIAALANSGSTSAFTDLKSRAIHESEYGWIGSPLDAIIENNGSVPELHAAILADMETHNDTTMVGRPLSVS